MAVQDCVKERGVQVQCVCYNHICKMSEFPVQVPYQPFPPSGFPFILFPSIPRGKHLLSQDHVRAVPYGRAHHRTVEIFCLSGFVFPCQAFPAGFLCAAKQLHPVNRCRSIPADGAGTEHGIPICFFHNRIQ